MDASSEVQPSLLNEEATVAENEVGVGTGVGVGVGGPGGNGPGEGTLRRNSHTAPPTSTAVINITKSIPTQPIASVEFSIFRGSVMGELLAP